VLFPWNRTKSLDADGTAERAYYFLSATFSQDDSIALSIACAATRHGSIDDVRSEG
jgi:hypothetical protein